VAVRSLATLVAQGLAAERFALLDVGCSGGLDPKWRAFGQRLRAIGIDASATECQRLTAAEDNPDIEYVATFVSPRADRPIDLSAGPAAPHIMKMRDRMSFMRTREIREERLRTASTISRSTPTASTGRSCNPLPAGWPRCACSPCSSR
jgi:hypothetical protein